MTRILDVEPGLYVNMSNRDYHRAPGISKSGLDYIADNPSSYIWYLNAPRDKEKVKTLDYGSANHCNLLEHDQFDKRYEIGPEVNRRTNAGKATEKEFLERCEAERITPLTHEEGHKLKMMRESVMAHPMARWLLEQMGDSESSMFWIDDETGEKCKVRPDRRLHDFPFVVDVKTTDDIAMFAKKVEAFRYHVQVGMYSEGHNEVLGAWPKFYFIVTASNISAGKYPVDVIELEPEWVEVGHNLFRENLNLYHHCKSNDQWLYARKISRPYWAKRK